MLESFDSSKDVECVHVARAADLRVTLSTRIDPIDHFPLATVKVYNAAKQDVIVGYEPGCVVLRCGDLRRAAPPITFVQRREILRPGQPLEFDFASGGWTPGDSTSGERELLTPTALPSGRYQVWATFRLGSADGPTIQSQSERYVVP